MGGVQFSTFYLVQELKRTTNIKIQLLLPGYGPFSELCERESIEFSIYKSQPMLSSSSSILQDNIRLINPVSWVINIRRIIYNSDQIRKIIRQYPNAIILTKGLYSHIILSFAKRSIANKLIWHLQDLLSNRIGGILNKILNLLATFGTNFIICDGRSIYDSLSPINQKKAKTILNGIDSTKFQRTQELRKIGRQEFNVPIDSYIIGHVGRITPWKGQIKLVEAFIDYLPRNNKAILILVGAPTFDSDKYLNDIKKLINQHKLKDRIILTGYRTDLNKVYSMMDLFIYPSLEKDTSPLALLSALSSGLPVAISSIESLKEIIGNFSRIPIFNPNKKSEITLVYKQFESEQLRYEISQLISRNFNTQLDMETHVRKMMEVFDSI